MKQIKAGQMMKNSENIVKYNYIDTMEYHFRG